MHANKSGGKDGKAGRKLKYLFDSQRCGLERWDTAKRSKARPEVLVLLTAKRARLIAMGRLSRDIADIWALAEMIVAVDSI